MVIVWQYGSNMNEMRLNDRTRLRGSAEFVGLALKRGYRLTFSHTNKQGIGVSDIVRSCPSEYVTGCLFEIPDRKLQKLDEIEGVNSGAYRRIERFSVIRLDEALTETSEKVNVVTYVVSEKEMNPKTDTRYANHILKGIREHRMGEEYFNKVKEIIIKNNPRIGSNLVHY